MTQPQAPEVSPEDLIAGIESGKDIQVLDIRAPERLSNGSIDLVSEPDFINLRGSAVMANPDPKSIGLRESSDIAVVCDRGNSSKVVAAMLIQHGFQAASVSGGMAAWMHTLARRELPTTKGVDHLIQFDRVGKGALAYLLASDGKALIVDPPRKYQPILSTAAELGAQVVGVAETHVHADYISGGPALSQELGVPYYLHEADSSYPYDGTPGKLEYQALAAGSTIPVGQTSVEVFHNPGHTLGSVSYLVNDDVALTGDFIFVQSLGRPDLGGKSEEWTPMLWDSLERAKSEWPGSIRIYPAHYSSVAERNRDRSIGKRFDEIRETNEPVAISDSTEFAAWVSARKSEFPPQYKKIKGVNIRIFDVDDAEADVLDVGKNECAVA